jgi:hypothetical protein
MIDRELAIICAPASHDKVDVVALQSDLVNLRDALERVEKGLPADQLVLLEDAILRSYQVSYQGFSESLESRLKRIGFATSVCESPQVQKIDKLSKY